MYVFGSFARQAEHEGSDIDLLVVGELPGRVFDQVGEVLRRTTLPVEPIVMRAEAFERRRRVDDPFLRAIIGEGLRLVLGACAAERNGVSAAAQAPGAVGLGAEHGACDGFGGARRRRGRDGRATPAGGVGQGRRRWERESLRSTG